MPYLDSHRRHELHYQDFHNMKSPGDLNYAITELINMYLSNDKICYNKLNEIVGALECCKLELYRRVVAPYEDVKLKDNGDVYDCKKGP